MIAVSYIMKRKKKKNIFEVISNSKIFNIIFFNEMVNDQDFPKLTGGLGKGGGDWTRSNTVLFFDNFIRSGIIFLLRPAKIT